MGGPAPADGGAGKAVGVALHAMNGSAANSMNGSGLAAGGWALNASANATNATAFIDVEEDRISPGWAVLLMYMMLFMILGAQTGLVVWRKQHKRSYELVSLAGLWLMPAVFSVHLKFWRFLAVWAVYSGVTGYLVGQCLGKRVHHTLPRRVYAWFLGAHRVSVGVGMAGYALLVLDMFGVGLLLARWVEPGLSLVLLWYGLYFGILGRDLAEVASEQMANVIGSGKRLTSSVNACGICGGELNDFSHVGEESEGEPVRQLACKHCFHELCVRGWTIVGKKDVCPVCHEKVDMRDLYADKPWETQNLSWIQMLDALRYMIVWNPLIFLLFTLLARVAPHHHVVRHIAVAAHGAAGAAGRPPAPGLGAGLGAPPAPLDAVDMGGLAAGA
ncbi:rnf121 [Scenedesmus sp. PABB004]|nr:rnf121 [Scenedesmus sp. PABB004]